MITRILTTICLALAIVTGLFWWRLDSATERAGRLDQQLQTASDSNHTSQETITRLKSDIAQRDQFAAEAMAQRDKANHLAAQRGAELEKLKNENADLRSYLARPIPRTAADWMWLPADSRNQNRNGKGNPSSMAHATDGKTSHSIRAEVTEEQGWKWCKAVEAALDSCNADKAQLREWVASHSTSTSAKAP